MKIFYIHQHFRLPYMQGGTRSYWIMKKLIDEGHKVTVIAAHPEKNKSIVSKINYENINIIWISAPYKQSLTTFDKIYVFLKFMFFSSFYSLTENYDFIYTSSTPLTVVVPALIAKLLRKKKYILEIRDLWPEMPISLGVLKNKILIKLALFLEKTGYENSTRLVSLSPGMEETIKSNYGLNSLMVPNFSNIEDFNIKDIEKRIYSLREERQIIIGYLGTLGLANNVEYLLILYRELKKYNLNIKFILCGSGTYWKSIYEKSNIYSNSFLVLPKCSFEEALELQKKFDISFSSSALVKNIEKSSQNKFFQGLASGSISFINYGGWQSKKITKNKCGLALDYDIPKSAKLVRNLILNKELLIEYSFNARKLAEKEFSRQILCSKISQAISEL